MSSEEDSYETYDGTSSSEVELPEPTPPPAAPTTPAPAGLVDEMSSTEEYHTFAADSNDSFDVTSSEYSEYDESSSVEDKVAIDMPSDSKIVQHVDGVNYEQSAYSKRLAQSKSEKLDFRWENISYWVKVKKEYKPILKNVSGECKAGTLMAIMGASGAGKTSLLNVLAGRADGTARGTIQINKKTFSGSEFRHLSAYVLQEDLLFGNLTVRETLMYAAKLRLPSSVSVKSKEELVQGLIEELGLVKCADNYVGSTMRRGISGGEKKRLSIACELIIDPSILFLDEPTSGLDAFTALNLIHTLQLLAKSGRTVICTIHQPRSGIYDLFDSLMLLAEGEVAYFGPAADAVHYFEKAGYKCPRYTNPADFFLDVTAINTHSEKNIKASKQHIRKLLDEFATSRRKLSSLESKPQKLDVKTRQGAGFFSQLIILSKRAAQNLYRDKPRTIFRIVQNIIVAVVLGLIFLRLDTDEIAVRDRSGLLFFIIINQGFGTMFQTLNVFLEEREIFAKERSAAWYSAGPYFLSKSLAELPMTFTPIILGCIVYFIANLNPSAEAFGFFLLVIYLTTFVTESLGLAIGALATSVAMANAMAPLLLIFLLMFGGFYINPDSIPVYFKWAEYVSFVRYGFEALVVNEFEGTTFTTVEGAPLPGSAIISNFGMDADWRWIDVGILVGMAFLFRLLAFLFLKFLRRGPRGKTLEPLSDADTHLSLESKETSDANNNNNDTALKERKKK